MKKELYEARKLEKSNLKRDKALIQSKRDKEANKNKVVKTNILFEAMTKSAEKNAKPLTDQQVKNKARNRANKLSKQHIIYPNKIVN